ncbi:toprim domain-containing protein [Dyadobacter sandarakinus]|uniref:Toprim domain-containing protein n=1 Tax=Dyadobacter sandarakinus TaxID=2747268 RepID=A0ABX7I6X8_9BACT|nr:toprim domain-containing protein [Dyadobacter sandarakinus]QRR01598.1 toprim domain-containing protein [Dyadobacter sandarakinus]
MTCEQAKEIPIIELLRSCNIQPDHIRGSDHWYLSPFRKENTPSFKVNTRLNLYFDHGSGQGGDIIDLGKKLYECDTKELLRKLESGNFSFHQQPGLERLLHIRQSIIPADNQDGIQVTAIKDLGSTPAISRYLESRAIDLAVARKFLKEIYYDVGGKSYFAAGFENRAGGYELRSQYFKGSTSPKDITHIQNVAKSVCVLEGFIDFLSLLSQRKPEPILSDFLILNSVALADRAISIAKNYENVFIYPDNDPAGRKVIETFQKAGIEPVDLSHSYRQYKDLNEMLMAEKIPENSLKKQQIYKRSRGIGF